MQAGLHLSHLFPITWAFRFNCGQREAPLSLLLSGKWRNTKGEAPRPETAAAHRSRSQPLLHSFRCITCNGPAADIAAMNSMEGIFAGVFLFMVLSGMTLFSTSLLLCPRPTPFPSTFAWFGSTLIRSERNFCICQPVFICLSFVSIVFASSTFCSALFF